MALAWYVVRTNPRSELIAHNHLVNYGFEHYLPLVAPLDSVSKGYEVPLFPSYLFLRYDIESPESTSLRSIPGLNGLVNFDGVPPSIPDAVIDSLRQTVALINETGGLTDRYQSGDRVWVRWGNGATEDLARVISDSRSPHSRVRVLIEFLGRLVHGEVSRSNIRPANDGDNPSQVSPNRARRRTRGRGRYVSNLNSHSQNNTVSSL